jgi:hypothetical protein
VFAFESDSVYQSLWAMMIAPLYSKLFLPLFELVIPRILSGIDSAKQVGIAVAVAMIALALLMEFFLWLRLRAVGFDLRAALRILLHVPPQIAMATPRIVKVLSDDFSRSRSDSASRNSQFYNKVFMLLPDAVLYGSLSTSIIKGANKKCAEIFGQ